MFRWLKIVLCLLALALAVLGTLPWWLSVPLRPILRAQDISFERYERVGYAKFRLHGAQYTRPGLVIAAKEVEADTPMLWLGRWLGKSEPLITVDQWSLRYTSRPSDPADKKVLHGMADLQRLLTRLAPTLYRWLPYVQLQKGELRGFTPEMTLARAEWRNSSLKVEGLTLFGHELTTVVINATAANSTFTVTAQSPEGGSHVQLTWSPTEINAEGAWWEQPVKLNAHYAAEGWLPDNASAVAEHWKLPAARVKLGAPYAQVSGDGRATWRDGAFDLSLDAKAEPAAGTKAPPFEAKAAAHGKIGEVTLTALHVDAPFAKADLTAPVTFSVDHPLSAGAAQLTVSADLAKLPWIDAHGSAQGTVKVTGDAAHTRQTFELEFKDVVLQNLALAKARVRGVLEWPELKLETAEVQLDKTGTIAAHGAVNWQTREFSGVSLHAMVGPGWFARWLPKETAWSTAEIDATIRGSLDAPQHEGSLKISELRLKPLQPMAVNATWQGTGNKVEIQSARAKAGDSTLELTGSFDAQGMQVGTLAFAPHGQPAWQLSSPARVIWSPTWQVENFQMMSSPTAAGASVQFTGKGGTDGFVEISATAFDSAYLQDWIKIAGPHWRVHTLKAHGRVVDGVLAFDTALTAQIEMEPQPAEVKLTASGDGGGVQLTELTVVESNRVLTKANGRLPVSWKFSPTMHVAFDETAPLELSASTDPASPLWAALASYTGIKLTQPRAKIELKGSLREPTGELQLQATQLGLSPGRYKFSLPEFEDLELALQLGRKTVTLTKLSTKLDNQILQASGQLPMNDQRWEKLWRDPAAFDWSDAQAKIEIPDADLAVLGRQLPNFVASKGRLRAKVELAPGGKFSGELHLTDAASRPIPPFSTLQEINADLSLADRTFSIQKLNAKIGGEPVTIDGSVTLGANGAPRLALGLKGKNLPLVRNTGLLVRNDVDLHANTDAAGVTRISGVLTLRDCLVLANLGALLPTGQRGVTRQPPYFAVEAVPFRSWPLAVEVRGQQAIKIRTTVFNGTASARFQLSGTLGEPRAVGELTVDQGQVLFPFATFAVQNGTVRLRESDPFHAVVNVVATSQRRDYQLRLEATGQLPTPNIVMSSTPALEAADVLLMVMTGQPPTNDPTASSATQRLALLGAYLGRGIFQDLGLGGEDRLEISAGEQVSLQGRETYDFEYKLDRRWSLTGEYDRFDSYNAGVKWRVYTEESKPVEKK